MFIGFQNLSTYISSSTSSDGLSGGGVCLMCAPVVPPVLLSLSSDFGSSPFFLSPFYHRGWLAEFLLEYCVDRYLVIPLIVDGYVVIFPWEYARHKSLLALLFFKFIRKSISLFSVLPLASHTSMSAEGIALYSTQVNDILFVSNNAIIATVPFKNLPAIAFTAWYLILIPLLWNHEDCASCCYCRCSLTSMLQLAWRVQIISLHHCFQNKRCVL